jgi:hypothetical protein
MAANLKSIIENIKTVTESPSMVAAIIDFERVLDEMDMYAYANWQFGELVEGPVFEKYFVTCTFMWPYTKMPDPDAAKRLLQYDIEVEYNLDRLEVPVKIKSPYDYKPGTKFAKHKFIKVWLVTITMPKDLISNIQKGTVELENEQLDLEDIEEAYSEGMDEEENEEDEEGSDEDNGNQEGGQEEMALPGGNPGGMPGPGMGAPNV